MWLQGNPVYGGPITLRRLNKSYKLLASFPVSLLVDILTVLEVKQTSYISSGDWRFPTAEETAQLLLPHQCQHIVSS
ncbi:hypothetical protein DPMN_147809 [Dreissena polymorpha]|uniref:Uncharacterized protein n=1 Tax=Dreissena polymorpha TaxID=45954 RepID=A0A9D4FBA2_DREPO|nr:hypothetical protein DPMN_147809 [Dreissena polymorpha]